MTSLFLRSIYHRVMDVKVSARRMPIEQERCGKVVSARHMPTEHGRYGKVVSARWMPIEHGRYGKVGAGTKVCSFWLAGRCTRNPCRFLHVELPSQKTAYHEAVKKRSESRKSLEGNLDGLKHREQLCHRWANSGSCGKGDKCQFQHSWSRGEGFGLLAKLEGHQQGIAGVGIPSGSDKLFSGSKDGIVKIWDCHTGQCSDTIDVGGEVGSFICEGPWVFVGMRNVIKAWNTQTTSSFDLEVSPSGLVYSMAVAKNLLFAGCQNGNIMVLEGSSPTSPAQLVATLKGHSKGVVSLVIGANRLYSGSVDRTIRVWDIESKECLTTLEGHTDVVMSLLCWDSYLLSASLDGTIKMWVATSTEATSIQVLYTHNEDHAVLALNGMHDLDGKPILFSAFNDDSVHLYELPKLVERGRIYARREVRAIRPGDGGLFFTGDGTGTLNVWRWSEKSKEEGICSDLSRSPAA